MKKVLALLAVACVANTGLFAEEKPECLAEGDSVAAFYVTDVTGPAAGEKLCYRCRYGNRPVVSIFAREMNEEVAALVKEIDGVVGGNKEKKMAAFVVLLSDQPEAQNDKLKAVAEKQQIKETPLTTFDGAAGPAEYKIAKEADITVMMWVDGKVKVNETLKKDQLSKDKIATLKKSTDKILN
ncbi:MAG: hypothetical protein KF774_03645 [Planctomyces sp.]|nr:hypothetical protein [Planctomyces sp.]